ncbi:MAG: hypothetical protein LC635_03755 [Pseudonocardiaceae bacterium]|nr:hypothetical protein [Pseudonocardiaceae bacterium]
MAGERIDNLSEAKRLQREHRERDVAYLMPDITAGPAAQHGVSGVDMDGIEADFAALRQAERDLAGLHDGLVQHLRDAAELTGPLGDGSTPVTGPMRRAFRSRADIEGGVQTALLDYLEELVAVRVAILNTLATYEGVDTDTANRLRRQMSQLEEIG